MARVIAVVNQKGGVGKTTTAVNLAAGLALAERRTLLVDLDPQGNATTGLGVRQGGLEGHRLQRAPRRAPSSNEATVPTMLSALTLVPSEMDLVGAEIELVGPTIAKRRLKSAH